MSHQQYHHWGSGDVLIDEKKSRDNYQTYIFDYFSKLGYQTDVYYATNEQPNHLKLDLEEYYKPKATAYLKSEASRKRSRNLKFRRAIELCLASGITYDLVLITRFDLHFQKPFHKVRFDLNKVNIVSRLGRRNDDVMEWICDNFYLLPGKLLPKFKNVCRLDSNSHRLQMRIESVSKIHYIMDQHRDIHLLSFYKIVRTADPDPPPSPTLRELHVCRAQRIRKPPPLRG